MAYVPTPAGRTRCEVCDGHGFIAYDTSGPRRTGPDMGWLTKLGEQVVLDQIGLVSALQEAWRDGYAAANYDRAAESMRSVAEAHGIDLDKVRGDFP